MYNYDEDNKIIIDNDFSCGKLYIDCPFSLNNDARGLGCKFDNSTRLFYIDMSNNLNLMSRYNITELLTLEKVIHTNETILFVDVITIPKYIYLYTIGEFKHNIKFSTEKYTLSELSEIF